MEWREQLHITDIFRNYATVQQERLHSFTEASQLSENGLLHQLLSRYHSKQDVSILKQALLDPYFPLEILGRTIFSDVAGMRFYINKHRADLEPVLALELLEWTKAFHRIRLDIPKFFDPKTATCIPLDGKRHKLPSGQWCTLCGVCCQIGGVPSNPPTDITYPDHWHAFLTGESNENQQLCPFLFQYFGEPVFFCGIHNIKPIACRTFDQEACNRRLAGVDLHLNNRP